MKISVITVTYNAAAVLEKTILSVIGQSHTPLEYIIIDGGSQDATPDIIQKYAPYLAYWKSEPDRGIYDAMNKGIQQASGEWINFMNAGDTFFDRQVIASLTANIPAQADVVYGDYRIIYPNFAKIKHVPRQLDELPRGMILNHQSIFLRSQLAKQNPFDLQYRLAADFNQLFQLYCEGKTFYHCGQIIADYQDGGLSAARKMEYIRQCREIVRKWGKASAVEGHYRQLLWQTGLIARAQKWLPAALFEELMQLKYRWKQKK